MGSQTFASLIKSFLMKVLLLALTFYKKAISPYLPMACRFYPTCSSYAGEAISLYGPWRGLHLTFKRLVRCQPFGGSGIDFVPDSHYCAEKSLVPCGNQAAFYSVKEDNEDDRYLERKRLSKTPH